MEQMEWDKAPFGRDVEMPHYYCDKCRCEILLPFLNKGTRMIQTDFGFEDLCVSCFETRWSEHEAERIVLRFLYGSDEQRRHEPSHNILHPDHADLKYETSDA